MLSTDSDGWITNKAFIIFLDAIKFHLGHKDTIIFDAKYYLLDSINAKNYIPIFSHTSFPIEDDEFTIELRDKVISNSFNNYSNALIINNDATKPNVLECFNILNLHYVTFE